MRLFVVGLMLLGVGALVSLLLRRTRNWAGIVASATAVAGGLLAAVSAIPVLWTGEAKAFALPWHVPFGSFSLALDPLSAVFVLPIGLIVAASALYGHEYLRGEYGTARLATSWFFFNLLAATMLLVVTARNGVLFLVGWEVMSLASFFLVLTDHEQESVRQAAWTYLVAAHLGTACLLVLFLLLGGHSASLDFDKFSCTSTNASAVFLLAVVGFGVKAGFVPVHVWLPEAHPAAPSHVSALMSGVMIKTGIYGLVRILTFLGEPLSWWGWTLVGVGVASGILGVLLAIAQHDLKRLLAYHSVENIGIISLGLGVGLLGMSYRIPAMAVLGTTGALLHVLNHALFKSLLFLGAGAVLHATGTRDIDRLGGLWKRMPVTAGSFLVGACAISGLPPLNGFVSEFLIFLGVVAGAVEQGHARGAAWALLCIVAVGGLALIGGLAAACFTKAFGCVFLGEPRTKAASEAHEAGPAMRTSMLLLAGGCFVVALTAPLWPCLLVSATSALAPAAFRETVQQGVTFAWKPLIAVCAASWLLLGMAGVLGFVRRKLLADRHVEQGPTWDCGYAAPSPRMQYTASSFASPLVSLFRIVLRPRVHLHPPEGLFPRSARFESETPDVFRELVFQPVFAAVIWTAAKLRWLQQGRIQLYVLYIALTILALMIWKLG